MEILKKDNGQEKYLWEIEDADSLQRNFSMCLCCGKMNPEKPEHCEIIDALFDLCKKHNNSIIVTRCDSWIAK